MSLRNWRTLRTIPQKVKEALLKTIHIWSTGKHRDLMSDHPVFAEHDKQVKALKSMIDRM